MNSLSLRKSFVMYLIAAALVAAALSLGTLLILANIEQGIYDRSYSPSVNVIYDEESDEFLSTEPIDISLSSEQLVPVYVPLADGKSVNVGALRGRYNADFLVYGSTFTVYDPDATANNSPDPVAFDCWGMPLPPSLDKGSTAMAMDEYQQKMWEVFVQQLADAPDSNAARSFEAVLGKIPTTADEAQQLFREAYGTSLAFPFDYFSTTMYTMNDLDLLENLERGAYLLIVLWFALCFLAAGNRFYRSRLARPLGLLGAAANRIGQENLDFAISYERSDEMGQLAASFETMRASLETSQRQLWQAAEDQHQLNAAFAHDLRTPLAVLRGRLEMLQEYATDGELSPEKLAAACKRLLSQVQRLEDYVNTMGNLQRLDERSACLSAISPDHLEGSVKLLADTLGGAADKTVAVSLEGNRDAPLLLDESLVMEVTENLLANALRYANEQVEIAIILPSRIERDEADEISSLDDKPDSSNTPLCIQIRDDGPGFSPLALASARRPFFTEARDNGHLGVGLSIAAALCELHGGTLALENAPEGGALATASFDMARHDEHPSGRKR